MGDERRDPGLGAEGRGAESVRKTFSPSEQRLECCLMSKVRLTVVCHLPHYMHWHMTECLRMMLRPSWGRYEAY